MHGFRATASSLLNECGKWHPDAIERQLAHIENNDARRAYDHLKPLTRRLMAQMQEDLGTRLEWIAVDHFNTGYPHTHVILRGKDDGGRDLVIAREYITRGLRERAAELVTLDLGPRTDLEIETRLRREVEQERLTSLDRRLLRDVDEDGLVGACDRDAFRQSLRAGRLRKLRQLGLAKEVAPGRWRLADGLEHTLQRMGERGDIIKTTHRELAGRGIERAAPDYVIYDPASPDARPVIGRVVMRGLSDEINDRHYLIIDGVDGRAHYVDIGKGEAIEPTLDGTIVCIDPRSVQPRQVDRTVAEIAAAHGGRYDIDIHLRHDPTATAEFAETHVRRLEAIRRATAGVEREPDGTWLIALDHLERAVDYERARARSAPVLVQILSALSLDRQVKADGATWLDRQLIAERSTPLRDSGFGRAVQEAQARRRHWLIEQGLAHQESDRIVYRADMLSRLRRRELDRIGRQLSSELGLSYVEAKPGERIEGVYRRSVDLASGRFAVIERSRSFTLAPWRLVLERSLGKHVSGIARGETISWTIGQQRRGPSIS